MSWAFSPVPKYAIAGGIILNLMILMIPLLFQSDVRFGPTLIIFLILMSIFSGAEMLADATNDVARSHSRSWPYLPHLAGAALLAVLWVSVWDSAGNMTGFSVVNGFAALGISAGIALRYISIATLQDKFLSYIDLTATHSLVRTGIYGRVRHPSELGLAVIGICVPLLLNSVVGGVVFAATLFPLICVRILFEDRMLATAFPTEFPVYKSATPAIFPKRHRLHLERTSLDRAENI